MIKVENVSYKYKNSDKKILDNLNFSINDGEIVAIVGENGSGKSTIARLLSGIIKLKEGLILVDDLDIKDKSNYNVIQEKIGIVFQNPENQVIFNSIHDEVAFMLKNIDKDDLENRLNDALEQVEMLELKEQELYTLSLGQKQRMMIAEVLAKKPKYIIFDEPTTMIDSQGKEKIYTIIKNLKNQGYTVICITNLADEILLADRTLVLNNGKIACEIDRKDLIEKAHLLEQYNIMKPTILNLMVSLREKGVSLEVSDFTIEDITTAIKEKYVNE